MRNRTIPADVEQYKGFEPSCCPGLQVRSYCMEVLEMISLASCLRWLTRGCIPGRREVSVPLEDLRACLSFVFGLQNCFACHRTHEAPPCLAGWHRVGLLNVFLLNDIQCRFAWLLDLQWLFVEATLPSDRRPWAGGNTVALSRHLLVLAQGRGCEVPPGPSSPSLNCLDLGPPSHFHSVNSSYLNPTFVGCVARIFHGCAGRSASATLTAFRSACQATCAVLMLFGYVRMLCMRVGCQRRQDTDQSWLRAAIQQALTLCSSRVGVGLPGSPKDGGGVENANI
ncbi:unnamed protein product [Symbiodinium sp. CCMP2592]|nr:unnamed protein product [Symbiodinium sp. CCMP2592]